jgi:hypothetical protein
VENVVVDFFRPLFDQALWLLIVSHEDEISEGPCHEELLKHGNHVANAA